ncbi:MAG: altronate dehydratase family protein [Planctomycetales bacterium]|jgi:altronate hydrolase|nr:altronate dehydratase family protein [Planctomycetales bacterium]
MTTRPFIRLHSEDNIAVASQNVSQGMAFSFEAGGEFVTVEPIDIGHKVALRSIQPGQAIKKFGQTIGFASQMIAVGSWVHSHNLSAGDLTLDYAFCSEIPSDPTPILGRTFRGFRRPDGRAATRNYIGIVSTVNCSATTSKYAAQQFDRALLEQFPNVDGVIPLIHKGGCAIQFGGEDHRQLTRTLSGFAKHPNIAAYIVIGLGCETGQASFLMENGGLLQLGGSSQLSTKKPLVMNIQDQGGVAKTVKRAVAAITELLPDVNRVQRVPIPVSEIILGMNCGGSDGNSGTTANPALGHCTDLLVAHGATSVLAETPEAVGGEHLLTRRSITPLVAQAMLDRVQWWVDYMALFNQRVDVNPSVGNKKGGLTTIYEKSLGAIAKGGTTALKAVYQYAELVTEKGFVFMDTPGYDPASVTGLVAGGANVVCFTTGRGSCFGCKPTPSIKVATNTPMYNRMIDDMDINAGRILEGASVEEVGREIFEEVIAVASGKKTKSEAQGIGDEEFCPWTSGPIT